MQLLAMNGFNLQCFKGEIVNRGANMEAVFAGNPLRARLGTAAGSDSDHLAAPFNTSRILTRGKNPRTRSLLGVALVMSIDSHQLAATIHIASRSTSL
jgi:hypothetical protein